MIVERTYELLGTLYGRDLGALYIDDVRIGMYLTAVKLSDGCVGTASSLGDDHPFCTKANRDYGDFTPFKIKGRSVKQLFESCKESNLIASLRIASLNAVSAGIISSGSFRVVEDKDPVDLLEPVKGKIITIVGAFQSYIKKMSQTPNRLHVLELNENAFQPEHKKYFIHASDYKRILSTSDIVIITGQTLVNNTIDDLLAEIKQESVVIVTGPSGSMLPDALFEKGVSIIGATRLTNPDMAFEVVGQGGMAYHMFEYCARKICILKG